jgi:hypothetical protein
MSPLPDVTIAKRKIGRLGRRVGIFAGWLADARKGCARKSTAAAA